MGAASDVRNTSRFDLGVDSGDPAGYENRPLDCWVLVRKPERVLVEHMDMPRWLFWAFLGVIWGAGYLVCIVGGRHNWFALFGVSGFMTAIFLGIAFYFRYQRKLGPSFCLDRRTGEITMNWVHKSFLLSESTSLQFISAWNAAVKRWKTSSTWSPVCRINRYCGFRLPAGGAEIGS